MMCKLKSLELGNKTTDKALKVLFSEEILTNNKLKFMISEKKLIINLLETLI